MRLKDKLSARASVLIISVFASPGTPSNKQCPRLKSEINSSSITWSWPTMTWPNCERIRSRASASL